MGSLPLPVYRPMPNPRRVPTRHHRERVHVLPLRRAPTSSIDMCQSAVCGNHHLQLSYGALEDVSATAYLCVIVLSHHFHPPALKPCMAASVDFQKWGLCCSQSAGPCQILTTRRCAPSQTPSGWSDSGEFAAALPTGSVLRGIVTARDAIDVPRHATTAKEFTLCRCAELRPAPLTFANLLFVATTTCSFLTVSSRLYQRQPISASSQPSATRDLIICLRSITMDKCPIPQPRRCASCFWHIFLEHRYFREPPTPVRVLGTTTMAFGQGTDVTGGYRSCPAVQCGATVTSGLTATRPVAPGGLPGLELQQARTRSLLLPVLICAIPLRPNRRQILPTAWASSEFSHSTAHNGRHHRGAMLSSLQLVWHLRFEV